MTSVPREKQTSIFCTTRQMSLLAVFLTVWLGALGQGKLVVERGRLTFISEAQLENIRASSDRVTGVIDPATNRFAFVVPVATFAGFNNALQREHFNEKYMESEKYPMGSFTGKIIEQVDFTRNGTWDVRAKGELDLHGRKQVRIIKCRIVIKGAIVNAESDFVVPLADHNISVPRIISQKIANEIKVNFKASLSSRPQ